MQNKPPISPDAFALRLCSALLALLASTHSFAAALADERPAAEADRSQRIENWYSVNQKAIRALQSFRHLIDQPEAAIPELRRLQVSNPDTLVPLNESKTTFAPLHQVVFQEFYRLPAIVRSRLAENSAAEADGALRSILQSGDTQHLRNAILRYPGTQASLRAHLIAAKLHLSRGNVSGAITWLTPLTEEKIAAEFRDTATAMLQQCRAASSARLEATTNAPPTNDRSALPLPQYLRWQYRTPVSPGLQKRVESFVESAVEAQVPLQSFWNGQFDKLTTYRKTMRGVAAIDLKSGGTQWEYPLLRDLGRAITSRPSEGSRSSRTNVIPGRPGEFNAIQDHSPLANLFCRNEVLGAASSDYERVYVAAADNDGSTTSALFGQQLIQRRPTAVPFSGSRIVAVEKSTGRRVWSMGTAALSRHFGTLSDGGWISGPPTVVDGRLYCAVECNGGIYLACMVAHTGEIQWTQELAYPDQTIDKDPVRRLWRCEPVVDDGLIWCVTTGAVVCVDELARRVVWATRLPKTRAASGRANAGRRQRVVATAPASLRERWASSKTVRAGDLLLVLSAQCHKIIGLNVFTGQQMFANAVEPSSILVHADSSQLIIASPGQIRRVSTTTGEEDWVTRLPAEQGEASGQGLRRGATLLTPMSSGRILHVGLETGKILSSSGVLLPLGAWGQLVEASDSTGDLFYTAPERLLRLTSTQPESTANDDVELAKRLMDDQKWSEALEALNRNLPPKSDFKKTDKFRFKCLLQIALRDPEIPLTEVQSVAVTGGQETHVAVLEAYRLLQARKLQQAAIQLVDLLERPQALTELPIPILPSIALPTVDAVHVQSSLPVRTWATTQLTVIMETLASDPTVIRKLAELPDAELRAINHSVVRPLLRKRAREVDSLDTAICLLRRSVELAEVHLGGDVEADVQAVVDVVQKFDSSQWLSAPSPRRLMLKSVLSEFPLSVVEKLRQRLGGELVPGRSGMLTRLRTAMQHAAEEWTPRPYRAIPVSRGSSSFGRHSVSLAVPITDDPFLSHFQWSATRSGNGRMVARSVVDGMPRWSIPGTFKVFGNYSNRIDHLYRFGSTLLLRSASGLAAVSVLDAKVAWNLDLNQTALSSSHGAAEGGFESFSAGRDVLPSETHYRHSSAVRFAGSGQDWLCLSVGGDIRVLDLPSGRTTWSVQIMANNIRAIATDDVVVAKALPSGPAICFDRRTGSQLSLPNTSRLADTGIRGAGRLMVCWRAATGESPASLEWIDPLNDKAHRTVPLGEAEQFQFLDDRTLTGIGRQAELTVIDLVTGQLRQCSYLGSNELKLPEEEGTVKASGSNTELPLWDSRRVQISADSLNYYVSNKVSRKAVRVRQPSGRRLLRFAGELRAIDRKTGKLRWRLPNEDSLLATTDQPGLPVLLTIQSVSAGNNVANSSLIRNTFGGVSKITGDALFKQSVPSRYGLRYALLSSPAPNNLDISLYGIRVRLEGEQPQEAVAE